MIYKDSEGVYRSTLFSGNGFPSHGFTTRILGDMRKISLKRSFLKKIGLGNAILQEMKQVHGDTIRNVYKNQNESTKPACDALIYQKDGQREDNSNVVVLSVRTADCVPILIADIKTKVCAVVHAGWRGTLRSIASKTLKRMKSKGSNSANIIAAIGPCIGSCCYVIPEERVQQFHIAYPHYQIGNTRHLDLTRINVLQILDEGVLQNNIDWSALCTSCRNDEFFSYRKDTKQSYGEIMGFITV